MANSTNKKAVGICETQPVTIEGVRFLLNGCPDLEVIGGVTSLLSGMEMVLEHSPSVMIIDKAFGVPAVMDWIKSLRINRRTTSAIVWAVSMSEAEALRLVQTGAQGIIHKTAELDTLLTCIRTVADGNTWMEESLFHEDQRVPRMARPHLTPREAEVMELVEQGLKNKEIAKTLGIRPGTVKIHLKHIFEKTGVHGRYGLALSGLREKGLLASAGV
jgi:two-component system nitrate/nitrite response regulator NarL